MGKVQLGFDRGKELLESYGISLPGKTVSSLNEVLSYADEVEYPVVIKGISKKIIHKTDVGAVILDIQNEENLRHSYTQLRENMKRVSADESDRVLIQKMAPKGFELIIGAKQDPSFGPVTMVGTGGFYVEFYKDSATGIGILTEKDVLRMLSETMAGKVLDGYRGQSYDKEAVIRLVINVSRFMSEHPEIHELDLNPVIVYEKGYVIVDSRLILDIPVEYPRFSDVAQSKMESINTIFNARSVAIVGASVPGTNGGVILKNCQRIKRLYPVNPRYNELRGMKCYPNLSALPEVPDVGIFAVNSKRTIPVFEEFCKLGGKGAIIFSDGFAETGRDDLQDELVRISCQYNVSFIGPNCMGVIDNFSMLNTNFIPEHRSSPIYDSNGIGIISQSGGIGLELLEMFGADNLNIGRWVSIGNAACVGVPEILAQMGNDDKISLIAIYLEGVADGLKLMEIGKEVAAKKPVLVIKGGIGGGAEAAFSHTASLAGSHEAFKASCEQAGFYLVEELTEDPKILVNILSILSSQPRTEGDRIAVVSVGGGAGILLADQITEEQMHLAEFTPQTRERIKGIFRASLYKNTEPDPGDMLKNIGKNPVDLLGNCDDARLIETIEMVDDDPNTDVIIAAIYLQIPLLSEYLPEKLVELKRRLKKPLIISLRGFSEYVVRCRDYLAEKGVHTYTIPMIKPIRIALDIWKQYQKSFIE